MKEDRPYLIVGAGLAGVCLAFHFRKLGKKVIVVDNGHNSSSAVAAGIINPIVFRRMTKSWRVDEFIPYGRDFYKALEKECQTTFYYDIVIRRLFSSEQERGFWEQKQNSEAFSDYLTPVSSQDDSFQGAKNAFGSGRVRSAAYVRSDQFLIHAKAQLKLSADLTEEQFDYTQFEPTSLSYKHFQYAAAIFCEGPHVKENPFFGYLPVQQTKGEILTIYCPTMQTEELLNRKCFVLPIGQGTYRVGATYVWNTMNNITTSEARTELTEKFKVLRDDEFEIIDQQAGVRPTTPDRRPILGQHADYKGLYVFNGLGTKGYMSAPLLAKELCAHILEGEVLSEEVRLDRFKKC
jgi:glycine/D-amino acid oxidase-like deaminating enzyme